MLEETKAQLKASRRAIHEAKASAISKEIEALNSERDALAFQLAEILERQSKLLSDQISEVRFYSGDAANSMELARYSQHANWIKKRFSRWL